MGGVQTLYQHNLQLARELHSAQDVDSVIQGLTQVIQQAADELIPKVQAIQNQLSDYIKNEITLKNRLRRICQKNHSQFNLQELNDQ